MDLEEKVNLLESILKRFLGAISRMDLEYKQAVPIYRGLLEELEAKPLE